MFLRKRFILLLLAFVGMLLTGCLEELEPSDVTWIHYSFHDASVPPEYHRSYDITVKPTSAHIQVDSYGDVLVDTVYAITTEQFESLVGTINNANLRSGDAMAGRGCVGGTSHDLKIVAKGTKVYEGRLENCGGNQVPKRLGDHETVIMEIRSLIPNLGEISR